MSIIDEYFPTNSKQEPSASKVFTEFTESVEVIVFAHMCGWKLVPDPSDPEGMKATFEAPDGSGKSLTIGRVKDGERYALAFSGDNTAANLTTAEDVKKFLQL